MAKISFDVRHSFDQSAKVVWDELVDWERSCRLDPGDEDGGRARRPDRGRTRVHRPERVRPGGAGRHDARSCRATGTNRTTPGTVEVEKIGPVLFGKAGFTVTPDGTGSVVDWVEDIEMRRLPQFLAPIAAWLGAMGFKQGMKGLSKQLSKRSSQPAG